MLRWPGSGKRGHLHMAWQNSIGMGQVSVGSPAGTSETGGNGIHSQGTEYTLQGAHATPE